MADSKRENGDRDALKTAHFDLSELEPVEGQETVRMEISAFQEVAEPPAAAATPSSSPAADRESAHHDGRFGDRFDDEIAARPIAYILVGLVLLSVAAFVLMGWMQGVLFDRAASRPTTATSFVPSDSASFSGPVLQIAPEVELAALREEMRQQTESYGWVDESAGIAYVPIDKAMDLVLENGLGPLAPPPQEESGTSPEEGAK